MNNEQKQALISYFSTFITDHKFSRMQAVLRERTRYITLVVEDIYQPHNASAMLRSAECFGVQNVHIVEQCNRFKATDGIAAGCVKWLSLEHYSSIITCYETLRKQGYTIVATTPDSQARPLPLLSLDTKCALVLGTEHAGLSKQALELADQCVTIPMYGFTQSFNVSVCASLCLYQLTQSLKNSSVQWRLSREEKDELLLTWLRASIRGSMKLEQQFMSGKKNGKDR